MKNITFTIFLFAILFVIGPIHGQNNEDLKVVLDSTTQRANYFIDQLQKFYTEGEYDLHKVYSDSLLDFARENNLIEKEILALNNQAVYFNSRSERLKAINLYHQALKKTDLIPKDLKSKVIVLVNMGNTYNNIGNYEKSIQCMKQVIDILEQMEESANSNAIMAAAYIGLSNNYIESNDYENTLFYAEKAREIGETLDDESIIATSVNNICDVYIKQQKYKEALELGEIAIQASYLDKPTKKRASILLNLGIASYYLDKNVKSKQYLQSCLELSKEKSLLEIEMFAHEYLAKIYEKNKDYKASILEQKEYKITRDSFLKDKMEASNEDLKKEISSKSETIETNKKELIEITKNRDSALIIGISILAILLIVLFIYVIRRRRLKVEQQKLRFQYQELQQNFNAYKSNTQKQLTKEISEEKKVRKPYKNSSLTPAIREEYKQKILSYMSQHKPYLVSEMTQVNLANQLDISSNHLSEVLYYNMEQNFYNFINSYRILEAQNLMKDPNYKTSKIITIAFDSGFKSKTTFNRIFKNFTGTTPSEYRKQIEIQ